jgi:hypothetical protein
MKIKLLFLSVFCVAMSASAQMIENDVIAADGDFFITSFGSVAFTEGEVIVETVLNSDIIVTQGFQQPWRLQLTSIDEPAAAKGIAIYPNPATDNFSVASEFGKGIIEIYSALGERVYKTAIMSTVQNINAILFPGIYFVKITDENKMTTKKLVVQ